MDGYNCEERSQEHSNILITLVYNERGATVIIDMVISNGRNMMYRCIVPKMCRGSCALFYDEKGKNVFM